MTLISKAWWRQAVKRWRCKTPPFFRKLRSFAVKLIGFAAAGEIIIQALKAKGLFVPDVFSYICTSLVAYGIATGVSSSMTTRDQSVIDSDPDPSKPEASC